LQSCLAKKEIFQINLIVYNFGYLPGGNHAITTKSKTSIESLKQAMALLTPGGVISLMLYPGHDEGKVEAQIIESYLKSTENEIAWTKTKADSSKSDAPFYLLGVSL